MTNILKSKTQNLSFRKNPNLYIFTTYFIALFLNAYIGSGGVLGLFALFFGGFSIVAGLYIAFIAWFSNLFFFAALWTKSSKLQLIFSVITLLLGSLAIWITELPMHEGASTSPVRIGIGFYFWILSYILLLAKSLLYFKKK